MTDQVQITARPRPPHAVSQPVLLTHAVLVGLTPLIPIPLLDDAVKGAIERRLVREIGLAHGRRLSKPEVLGLTDEGGSLLGSIAKGIVTFPFKLIFRKLFVVLEVKRASDEASRCYHRGLLLDLALGARALTPEGPRSPADLRKALDRTCEESKVSPIGTAVRTVFEGSKSALGTIGSGLLGRFARRGAPTDAQVEEAVEAAAAPDAPESNTLGGLVARLQAAIAEVPESYFIELEGRFERQLGVPLVIVPLRRGEPAP